MSPKERLRDLTEQLAEAARDPERLRGAARVAGSFAVEGALGEDGFDVMKTNRHGERKVRKVKAVREGVKAVLSPANAARKAGRGVLRSARREATDRATTAAHSSVYDALGSGDHTETVPDDSWDLPVSTPAPEAGGIKLDSLFSDDDWAETPQEEPKSTHRQRIAERLRSRRESRKDTETVEDTYTPRPLTREDLMADPYELPPLPSLPDSPEDEKHSYVPEAPDY
jgi:hypothetical protein